MVPGGTSSVRSAPARPVRLEPSPWAPRGRPELPVETVVDEGVAVDAGPQMHRAAAPAVAAVGTATGYELLPAKADAAPPAVTRFHLDVDLVDEHTLR